MTEKTRLIRNVRATGNAAAALNENVFIQSED